MRESSTEVHRKLHARLVRRARLLGKARAERDVETRRVLVADGVADRKACDADDS